MEDINWTGWMILISLAVLLVGGSVLALRPSLEDPANAFHGWIGLGAVVLVVIAVTQPEVLRDFLGFSR